MEKIRSACIYYYGLSKKLQNTYRVSVRFCQPIDFDIMRMSLDITKRRYPYFSVKRVKTFGEIRLEDNELPWVLNMSEEPITLGGKESNYHMIAFSFLNDCLYVDVFHGMTDGVGIMNLLRTLVYYYCREAYDKNLNAGNIRLVGDCISREEFDDPYTKVPQSGEESPTKKNTEKKVKYMNLSTENKYKITKPYVFRLQIPQDELMKYCGQNDGSPATALALFIARAIKKIHADCEYPIGCGIATDLRAALGTKLSHHSTVAIPVLEFTKKISEKELEMQGTAFRGQVLLKCNPDALSGEIYASNKFYEFLNGLHIRKFKEVIMRVLVKAALGGPTAVVSYVGKCDFGECEKYIKEVFSAADAPGTGIMTEVNFVNGIFCVAFSQEWKERTYFDAFCKELELCGISYTLAESGEIKISDMKRI